MADPEMQQFARRLVRSGLKLIQKYSKQEKTSTSDAGVRPAGEEMAP